MRQEDHEPIARKPLVRLVREIHHRSLWGVMGIYVAAGRVVFEVVDTRPDGLGLPGWFRGFAFVLLAIGFPVVLATAFIQEGGPDPGAPDDAVLEGIVRRAGDQIRISAQLIDPAPGGP